ncbi:MAG: hypothetical protein P8I03_09545 [Thalassotalea sp.]|nr:hypothetical protein [Thalassotalea sp.]
MNFTGLFELLKGSQSEAYLGPQGIKLLTNEKDFKQAQVGFSIDKNGANISGNSEGTWQRTWVVVAKDTELADPYYVDLNDENLTVYTAIFCEEINQWQSTIVSSTLSGFIECISLLFNFTEQNQPQFIPDSSSIFDLEKLEIFGIQLATISENTDFWKNFFISYVEWLQDEHV